MGKRIGLGQNHFAPHSTVLTFIGASLLWVGWYGFNAGSAVAADVISSNAFTTTTLATAIASFVWPTMEYILKGKATVIGFCSGAVAGLVVITPACGYVTPMGGVIIGVIAGTIPFLTTTYMKPSSVMMTRSTCSACTPSAACAAPWPRASWPAARSTRTCSIPPAVKEDLANGILGGVAGGSAR